MSEKPTGRRSSTNPSRVLVEQLARGLQQLVMMLRTHLQPHTQLVVAVLEAVVGREEAGEAAALHISGGGPHPMSI